jgi:tetratricopeptide (TPR) repeat protein
MSPFSDMFKRNNSKPTDKDEALAYFYSGTRWAERGEYNKAIQDLTKALEIDRTNVDIFVNRAATWEALGQYEKAFSDFSEAIMLDAKLPDAYFGRGNCCLGLKHYQRAIREFDNAIEIKPDYSEAFCNRGIAYDNISDKQNALRDYSYALEINPNDTIALIKRADIYDSLGLSSEALRDYNHALELDPNLFVGYINRADCYSNLGEHKKARDDCNKALLIDPKSTKALISRCIVYRNLGEYQKSVEDATKAISLNPRDGFSYYHRGSSYSYLKQYPQAIIDFNRSLELNPEESDIVYFYRGCVYKNMGNARMVRQDLETFVSRAGDEWHSLQKEAREILKNLDQEIQNTNVSHVDQSISGKSDSSAIDELSEEILQYSGITDLDETSEISEDKIKQKRIYQDILASAVKFKEAGDFTKALDELERLRVLWLDKEYPELGGINWFNEQILAANIYYQMDDFESFNKCMTVAVSSLHLTFESLNMDFANREIMEMKRHGATHGGFDYIAGWAAKDREDLKTALNLYEKSYEVLKSENNSGKCFPLIGYVDLAEEFGDISKAIKYLEGEMPIDSEWTWPAKALGSLYKKTSRFLEAIAVLDVFLSIEKDEEAFEEALFNRAFAYVSIGNYKNAIEDAEASVNMSNNPEKKQMTTKLLAIALFNRACEFGKKGQLIRALPLLERSFDLDPVDRTKELLRKVKEELRQ